MHSHIFYNLVMNQKEVHDRLLNSEGPRISRCIKEWNAVGILNICQQFGEDKSRTKKKKKKKLKQNQLRSQCSFKVSS